MAVVLIGSGSRSATLQSQTVAYVQGRGDARKGKEGNRIVWMATIICRVFPVGVRLRAIAPVVRGFTQVVIAFLHVINCQGQVLEECGPQLKTKDIGGENLTSRGE